MITRLTPKGRERVRHEKKRGEEKEGEGEEMHSHVPAPPNPLFLSLPFFPCSQSRPAFQQEKIFTDIFVLLFPAAMEVVHPEKEGGPAIPHTFSCGII